MMEGGRVLCFEFCVLLTNWNTTGTRLLLLLVMVVVLITGKRQVDIVFAVDDNSGDGNLLMVVSMSCSSG